MICTVEAAEGGEGVVYVLEDGSSHKSPSAAGMKVMGGKAVNGWRFWTREGEEKGGEEGSAHGRPPEGVGGTPGIDASERVPQPPPG